MRIDQLTCGEKANMRRALQAAREAFGDRIDPGFAYGWATDARRLPRLTPREQAVVDIARILDRLLS